MANRSGRSRKVVVVVVAGLGSAAIAAQTPTALPPVPAPPENPVTEAKRVLGKMLFFEEQLSSDDTVACATCHVMSKGGTDPRRGRNPGSNAVFGDLGDVLGSPGVAAMGADETYAPTSAFGAAVQVTPRTAPTPFAAMYQSEILWDGRAPSVFKDPDTGTTVIASGGALESQALLPLTNEVEMGHTGRDFAQAASKLAAARPLALALDVPDDVAQALDGDPGYPELFRRAFGDANVTPVRIAMAIATYERTLVPDQTAYDRYIAGESSALDDQQVRGLAAMETAKCTECHAPPLFTDGKFHATGVRPPAEDRGRAKTTELNADRGKFKVPTLRNAALKQSFFHDGQRTTLGQAVDFYAVDSGKPVVDGARPYRNTATPRPDAVPSVQFVENQDALMSKIQLDGKQVADITAFIERGLVDPRVQAETFPFDRPVLASERPDRKAIVGTAGRAGTGGVPAMVVVTPAYAGTERFRVGIVGGRPGGVARLVSWQEPSDGGRVETSEVPLTTEEGVTFATTFVPLGDAQPGSRIRFTWLVDDPAAPGGVAQSPSASVVVFPQRPRIVGGTPASTTAAFSVDDGDAYFGSARFAVDYARRDVEPAKDSFSFVAWLSPLAPGTDLSAGTVSVSVGGVEILAGAQIDARGKIRGGGASGLFDAKSGRLTLAMKNLGLREAILNPSSVPVRVEIAGLELAQPVLSSTLACTAKGTVADRISGRFSYRAAGTGDGVFHVAKAVASTGKDGRVHLRVSGAIDAPGTLPIWAPAGVTLHVGGTPGYDFAASSVVPSANGATLRVARTSEVKALEVDIVRRTFRIDLTAAIPGLAGLPAGTRVEIPLTFATRPSATADTLTFRTVATVQIAKR